MRYNKSDNKLLGCIKPELLTVTFLNTVVLYLRSYKKTPDKMKYVIITLGETVQYDISVMKVQTYSLEEIFEKRLAEYNENEQKLESLKEEYREIIKRLDKLEEQGR